MVFGRQVQHFKCRRKLCKRRLHPVSHAGLRSFRVSSIRPMRGDEQPAAAAATPATTSSNGDESANGNADPGRARMKCDPHGGVRKATFSFFLRHKWVMYALHLIVPSLLWVSFSAIPLWEPTSGFSWDNVTWVAQFLVILTASEVILFEAVFAFTHDEDNVYLTWKEPLVYVVLSITVPVLAPQALGLFPIPYCTPIVASVFWLCFGSVISSRYVNFMLARKIESVRADETLSRYEREERLAFLQNRRTKRRVLTALLCLVLLLGSYVGLAGACAVSEHTGCNTVQGSHPTVLRLCACVGDTWCASIIWRSYYLCCCGFLLAFNTLGANSATWQMGLVMGFSMITFVAKNFGVKFCFKMGRPFTNPVFRPLMSFTFNLIGELYIMMVRSCVLSLSTGCRRRAGFLPLESRWRSHA